MSSFSSKKVSLGQLLKNKEAKRAERAERAKKRVGVELSNNSELAPKLNVERNPQSWNEFNEMYDPPKMKTSMYGFPPDRPNDISHSQLSSVVEIEGEINYGPEPRSAWRDTKNMCAKVWETKTGKAAVIVSGFLAGYALVAAIVRAAKDAKVTEDSHSMPFNNTYLGTYNKDIDDRLKFITAAVSIQLRKLCDTEGADMSWESLEAILAQCPVLEADQNKVYGEETFNEEFSKVDDVNTWLYDFINKHDGDVLDAARIHNNEIRNVIKFVGDQSVEFNVFSKAVSTSTNLIDIGMIRFPTKTDPCVKLYRLQLRGTFMGKKFMMVFSSGENRSITASVSSHKYYPRDELLQRIQSENVKNTLNKFESMFK